MRADGGVLFGVVLLDGSGVAFDSRSQSRSSSRSRDLVRSFIRGVFG